MPSSVLEQTENFLIHLSHSENHKN